MLKILAIDTSTDACSAALLVNDEVHDRFVVAPREHTNFILPMIDELLVEAQLDLKQLNAIAFGSGPGSFTGIRLAASIAQGFAFASDLPVIRISTLRTLAEEAFVEFGAKNNILVAQDARMQEVYWGEYRIDDKGIVQAIKPDQLIDPHEINIGIGEDQVGVGSGFEVYKDVFRKDIKILPIKYPQTKYMVRLAKYDFAKGLVVSSEEALPVYLREQVA